MVGIPDGEKALRNKHNTGMCRTDRRTGILPRHSPRYAYASRGKKRQPCWNFTSGFDFDRTAVIRMTFCIKPSNFIEPPNAEISRHIDFYRATRMHSADYAVARCLSVRLSVCHTPVLCLNGYRQSFFHRRVAPPF